MHDVIIVGAGSAGCVLAMRLSADPACRVLLLEAGGEPPVASRMPSDWVTMFNTPADWGYHTVPQAGCRGRRIFWPRGRMLGGSSALNAMIYMRGLPSDFDGWASAGAEGWEWDRMLPDFIACEGNRDFQDNALHGTEGPLHVEKPAYVHPLEERYVEAGVALGYPANRDYNGESQEGFGFFQFTIREGERSGANRAYLAQARDRPNLTIETGVLITGLDVSQGRVTGVRWLKDGTPQGASAEETILSAGAIGSPQLLMLSGIGPADELTAAGVAPVHDLPGVGKNLLDHINIPISLYTHEQTGIGAWDEAFLAESQAEWDESRRGPRTSAWVAASAHVRSRPEVEPDLQFYGAVSPHRDYGRFLADRAGMTFHTTLQRPRSVGEITLRSADPLEHPDIDPKYFSSDPSGQDMATMIEGIRIQRRVAASEPLASLLAGEMQPSVDCRTDEELEHYIRGHCTTLYHAAGTCRMGRDPLAVVDPVSFRVHGLEGLRVADASLFPRMISGNTNATTIVIAERASRAVAGAQAEAAA